LAARTVSRTLNNVPIDRYVRITNNAFEVVDLLVVWRCLYRTDVIRTLQQLEVI